MSEIKSVGFIGLGRMGAPMAGHLAGAGFELVVADQDPNAVEAFTAEHGGTTAKSLTELGGSVDAVITMLPNSKIVRQVILEDGVADGLDAGKVVIDMSTSDPVDTRALGEALSQRGIGMIDAPVAGGVVFARNATLSLTVGGEADLLERCRPLLMAMGRDIFHCGPLASGHAMKALNNYVNASALITAVEALTIGRKFGLQTETMLQSMTAAATGRNNPIEKKIVPYVNDPAYVTGMALQLLAKDVRITVDMAKAIGAFAPVAETCSGLWTDAADRFGADKDQIEVARLWLEQTGVSLHDS